MKFSPSKKSFYDPKYTNCFPEDVVDVPDEKYASVMAGFFAGKIISSDSDGNPITIDRPPPTAAELEAVRVSDAKTLLLVSDMVALRCIKAGVAYPAEWKSVCVTCRAIVSGSSDTIPELPDYPAGT